MSEEKQTAGHIHDLGMLDLRYAKSPEELSHIHSISDIGLILIWEEAAAALGHMSINDVGSVVVLPAGAKVNCMTGQTKLTGESLLNGDPEIILMLVGQTFISGPIKGIGYKEIRSTGQLFLPRGSQDVLSGKLTQVTGQVFYIGDQVRIVMGNDEFDQEFLELLPVPTDVVVMGNLKFKDDVQKETLQAKITEIVLMGQIKAPMRLVSLLNVLTKEKMGHIVGE